MAKRNRIYTYSETLLSFKKEANSDTRYNMNKCWRHKAKWNKPVQKDNHVSDSTYTRYLEQSSWGTELGVREEEAVIFLMDTEFQLGKMKQF